MFLSLFLNIFFCFTDRNVCKTRKIVTDIYSSRCKSESDFCQLKAQHKLVCYLQWSFSIGTF